MKGVLVFLFSLISLFSFSQISYYNNLVSDEDNLSIRNYNGSEVREMKVVAYNLLKDSVGPGRMFSQKFFDIRGNKFKEVLYNIDSSVSQTAYYKYDSINRLAEVVKIVFLKTHNDTTFVNKIKYDNSGNIKSMKMIFSNRNYALFKNTYHATGLLKYQKIEYFYNYGIHYFRGDNRATLGNGAGSNWTIFWKDYQYYNEFGVVSRNNIKGEGGKVIHELYKIDKNNRILEIKSLQEDKILNDFSLTYNDKGFLLEKIDKLNQVPRILFKYTYIFYKKNL